MINIQDGQGGEQQGVAAPEVEMEAAPPAPEPVIPAQTNLLQLVQMGKLSNSLQVADGKLEMAVITAEKFNGVSNVVEGCGIAVMSDVIVYLAFDVCGNTSIEELFQYLSTDDAGMPTEWAKMGAAAVYDQDVNCGLPLSRIRVDRIRNMIKKCFRYWPASSLSPPPAPVMMPQQQQGAPKNVDEEVSIHLAKSRALNLERGTLDHQAAKEWLQSKDCTSRGCAEWLTPHPSTISHIFSVKHKNEWLSRDDNTFRVSPLDLRAQSGKSGTRFWWNLPDFSSYQESLTVLIYSLYTVDLLKKPEDVITPIANALHTLRSDPLTRFTLADWHCMCQELLIRTFYAYGNLGGDLDEIFHTVIQNKDTFDVRCARSSRLQVMAEKVISNQYRQNNRSTSNSTMANSAQRTWGDMLHTVQRQGGGPERSRSRSRNRNRDRHRARSDRRDRDREGDRDSRSRARDRSPSGNKRKKGTKIERTSGYDANKAKANKCFQYVFTIFANTTRTSNKSS